MHLWLLLAGALSVQEPISTSVLILQAYKTGYSPFLIHLLWLGISLLEMYIGYFLGRLLQRRFATSKAEAFVNRWVQKLNGTVGKNGERLSISLLTILTSPLLSGLFGSWFTLPLSNILFFGILGDLVWYITVWISVVSANKFATSFEGSIVVIIVISLISTIPFSLIRRKRSTAK